MSGRKKPPREDRLPVLFDELRFGAERTLNLRELRPTAEEAARRAETWLREKQVQRAGEVLVITGRGKGSEGGISVVREAVVRLLASLRRRGVVETVQEHTAGSFVVELAPLSALLNAGRRRREQPPPSPAPDPLALEGLEPDTRRALRDLAVHALNFYGLRDSAPEFVRQEMQRQFDRLAPGVPEGSGREARLREAIRRAAEEYDEH